jgi:hypothetical protein
MFDPAIGIDLDELRARLHAMDDRMLKQWGKSAARMGSPAVNLGAAPRPEFVPQLEEARAEWRRRHPKKTTDPTGAAPT